MQHFLREREGRVGGGEAPRARWQAYQGLQSLYKAEVLGLLLCESQLSRFAAWGTVLTSCRVNVSESSSVL
jgi:hypothetical protein